MTDEEVPAFFARARKLQEAVDELGVGKPKKNLRAMLLEVSEMLLAGFMDGSLGPESITVAGICESYAEHLSA